MGTRRRDDSSEEVLQEEEETEIESEDAGITNPFDPAKIKVETKQMSLDTLIKRMREREINLSPDFQRNDVWKIPAKSRLIESLLIRIPLPAFYMDATNEEEWLVVDGLQRLSTLRDFVIDESLKLTGLEFLKNLENKKYNELPRNFQRRIEETQVTVYLIDKGTPPDVKFNIFKRINTGGLPLSSQEIRHALNQGPVTNFIKNLAESKEFQEATNNGIRDKRMSDRECVVRFCAFAMTPYTDYKGGFDAFLTDAMAKLNRKKPKELTDFGIRFKRAMDMAIKIFEKRAFRKDKRGTARLYPISKALFEAWSVNLDRLTDDEFNCLNRQKEHLIKKFLGLMEDIDFENSVTQSTGGINRVHMRFGKIETIIRETLQMEDGL